MKQDPGFEAVTKLLHKVHRQLMIKSSQRYVVCGVLFQREGLSAQTQQHWTLTI